MNTHRALLLLSSSFLLAGNLAAQTTIANGISSVSPATANAGTSSLLVTFNLNASASPAPPPAFVVPQSASIGSMAGTSLTHVSQYVVTGVFTVPSGTAAGTKDVSVTFPGPSGTLTFTKSGAFQVTATTVAPEAAFSAAPTSGAIPLTVTFTNSSTGTITASEWSFGDGGTSTAQNPTHTYTTAGTFDVSLTVTGPLGGDTATSTGLVTAIDSSALVGTYPVVDTAQTACYDNTTSIAAPASGQSFHGQDAQYSHNPPQYSLSADGLTVHDHVTGLDWQRSPDRDGNGTINSSDKLAWSALSAYVASLNGAHYGGFSDWRLPTIKELYSLVDFRGGDPSGYSGTDTSSLVPFIDRNYFAFGYGDTAAGERIIDAQFWSSTQYVSTTMGGDTTVFGFNFADGRIKGYPRDTGPGGSPFTEYIRLVRGNPAYGINHFEDNRNNTITDRATGLMWGRLDSGGGMNWQAALAWVAARNAEHYLGFSDWRLPDVKEMQTLLDYTRSPATTGTAAIDPLFSCTSITAENGATDYPFYWTSTTHATYNGNGGWAAYVCFGTAFGYQNSSWIDVHGAGAQRSDPKTGSASDYPTGHGPQGDCVRVSNFVRLVRAVLAADDSVGDGLTDAWRRQHFGGTGTTTDAASAASADPDHDGRSNRDEYLADTDPLSAASVFSARGASGSGGFTVSVPSSTDRRYALYRTTSLGGGAWSLVTGQNNVPGTGGTLVLTDSSAPAGRMFYRVEASLP